MKITLLMLHKTKLIGQSMMDIDQSKLLPPLEILEDDNAEDAESKLRDCLLQMERDVNAGGSGIRLHIFEVEE